MQETIVKMELVERFADDGIRQIFHHGPDSTKPI